MEPQDWPETAAACSTRKAEIVTLAASEGARRGREQTLTQTRKKDLMSACLTFISYKYYILVVMQQPYKKTTKIE